MTRPTKRQWQWQRKRQWQWQRHFEKTLKDRHKRLATFETFDQSDEETWPNQHKYNDKDKYKDNDNDKDKYIERTPSKNDPGDLCPLRYLIRVMRGHDLTNKNTLTKTNTKTKTMTKTNTFREHLQRATIETFDLCDIWSELWGDMTWSTKIQWYRQIQRQSQWQRQWKIQTHLENTFKEQP